MIALLQRVAEARVVVAGNTIGEIGPGLLALIGVQRADSSAQAQRLATRLLSYRLFSDSAGKMNLNVSQAGGGVLLVPQFTLAADTNSGNRPSFTPAAAPDLGRQLFDELTDIVKQHHPVVGSGQFGADMQVGLINDGPVTFWLEVH